MYTTMSMHIYIIYKLSLLHYMPYHSELDKVEVKIMIVIDINSKNKK